MTGQFAVRGSSEVSALELMNLVEKSCGVEAGATKARFQMPVLPLARMFEEYLVGMGADTNMAEMIAYFADNQDAPVSGNDFWQAAGMESQQNIHDFFKSHRVSDSDESMLLPTFGGYKLSMAD